MAGSIVFLAMSERTHVQRLFPLVEGFVDRGQQVVVMTADRYREEIEACGAGFVDLFAGRALDEIDSTSIPVSSRNVTFAAACFDDVAREVRALAPALIVYDTFAVVAPLVGRRLGVPYVNVCAGHAPLPGRFAAEWRDDPRVVTSAACAAAVVTLREEHGYEIASPFVYGDGLSPFLNVYGEPSPYLLPADREVLEPLAFFGSVTPDRLDRMSAGKRLFAGEARRAYVSFGTIIWRYFAAEALAALEVLSDVLSAEGIEAIISLGGHEIDSDARRRIARPGVRVESYVDQWAVLAEVDLFVTHHGLKSTHEAVCREVPMVSYPFFGDQPALAERCHELGLAAPLADAPRRPLQPERVEEALETLVRDRDRYADRLAVASAWERDVIAHRGAVFDRMLALASEPHGAQGG